MTGLDLTTCPICGAKPPWAAPRTFIPGTPFTYWLCKWCGWRFDLGDPEGSESLAVPVFHSHADGSTALTWVEFRNGAYAKDRWTCSVCKQTFPILQVLRAFPRLTMDDSSSAV